MARWKRVIKPRFSVSFSGHEVYGACHIYRRSTLVGGPRRVRSAGYSSDVANIVKPHCSPKGVMKHNILTKDGVQAVTVINDNNPYRID